MSLGYIITIALAVLILGFYSIFKNLGRRNISREKGSVNKDSLRATDKRKLSRHEVKIRDQAKNLIAQKRFTQAARLLESIKLERDAIAILEANNHIHEAAQILLRMQRPGRAGILYARNGYWTNAAECFVIAGMFYEAGKAATESGDHKNAASLFESTGKLEEAGKSYLKAGLYLNAARVYLKDKRLNQAISAFRKKLSDGTEIVLSQYNSSDIEAMVSWLSLGQYDADIAALVQKSGEISKVVINLSKTENHADATKLLVNAKTEDFKKILSELHYEDKTVIRVADAFFAAEIFEQSGMIYEQSGEFKNAAISFEQYGDFERASYCYERSGDLSNANRLRSKKSKIKVRVSSAPKGFSLSQDSNLSDLNHTQSSTKINSEDPPKIENQVIPAVAALAGGPNKSDQVVGNFVSIELTAQQNTNEAEKSKDPENLSDSERFSEKLDFHGIKVESEKAGSKEVTPKSPTTLKSLVDPKNALNFSVQESSTEMFLARDVPTHLSKNAKDLESRYIQPVHKNFYRCSILVDLNSSECEMLWNVGVVKAFGRGDVILDGAGLTQGIFVVLEGDVHCFKGTKSDEKVAATITNSDSFGELVVLADYQTPMKLVSVENSKVWYCTTEKFESVLYANGSISTKIYKYYMSKLLNKITKQSKAS